MISNTILSALYLMLPAYIANMMPVISGKLHFPLGIPIGEKLFGAHKTWRGFYAGYLGALIALATQQWLASSGSLQSVSLLNYGEINIFLYAIPLGLGAIAGDAVKSFFKRRLKIKPGSPWVPFDQLDFVLGAYIFLLPLYAIGWPHLLTLLVITPFLHFLINIIAYHFGLKKVWW